MHIREELSAVTPEALARMASARAELLEQIKAGPAPGEGAVIRGALELVLEREDGSGLYVAQPNLITNAGFDLLCNVLGKNAQPSDLTHIAIGTGTTAAAAADTALETENARVSATYAHTAGTKVMTMTGTVAAGTGTGSITEAGSLNASANGTLFNRTVFSAVTKAAADSLQVTFTYTFS